MTASNSEDRSQIDVQEGKKSTYYIQEDESVTEAVVRGVCSVTQSDQTGLAPLYSIIETDALNTLFSSDVNGHSRLTDGVVAFKYAGNHIRVSSDGSVIISENSPVDNVSD
ncbi:HalOD1 output domain-containing protein [Halorussus sp. AFM4]|uniref:HalOD1 output domain-containing protein n=1 Tax=Halorussus sp. AFM4 TaxID=3421651 RepID=UPI003EB7F87C